MGWKVIDKYYYGSYTVRRSEYEEIGHREVIDDVECDISEVFGFSASKSELRDFSSTDEMVEANSRDMIDAITHEKLAKNLAHSEIRIIHARCTTDHFARYLWDGHL
ncbi:MAG: hypothetical protein EON54_11730, partial [Alcaligenaceae bacterium]